MLPFGTRKEIAQISIEEYFTEEEYRKIFINDIEKYLPKPNYTYITLRELSKKISRPIILMGTDVINSIDSWKESEEIKQYPIIKANRSGYTLDKNIECNIIDTISASSNISSTKIRKLMLSNPKEILNNKYMTEKSFLLYYEFYKSQNI